MTNQSDEGRTAIMVRVVFVRADVFVATFDHGRVGPRLTHPSTAFWAVSSYALSR